MKDINCWQSKFEHCIYSDRLLNKIFNKLLLLEQDSSNNINILEVKKAIYYAKKYHGSQMRQSGEQYYSHPLAVAYMIADHVLETDVLVTSILHDTIEDTAFTKEMINLIFGSVVANQVEDLTRIKQDRKISFMEMAKYLKQEKKYKILLIKCFDRLHNLQTLAAKSLIKQKETIKESLEVFFMLATNLELEIEQEIEISRSSINIIANEINKLIQKQDLSA